jgi:hypothetical protein
MATSYTTLLGLALPVTGELSGTWGDTVNNYLTNYLDSAVAGALTVTGDTTLTKTTGSSLGATSSQYAIIIASPASANITITAPAASKIYTIINTSGTYTVKIVGAGPTTGVTLGVSEKAQVAWNGSDFVKISNTSGAGVFSSITNTGLTSGRVVYSTTGGLETDSANLTFDGSKLTVVSNSEAIRLNGTSAYIQWRSSDAATQYGYIQHTGADFAFVNVQNGAIPFYTNNSEQMRLTSTGLGIGTSSPSTKLDVYNATNSDQYWRTSAVSLYAQANNTNASAIFGTLTNHPLVFWTNSAERMRLDSSGNLGLGVTPSAWGAAYPGRIQGLGWAIATPLDGGTDTSSFATNAYNSAGGTWNYRNNASAVLYQQFSGSHQWFNAPSGTAGNAITFTRAMTLDASGNLLVGTTAAAYASGERISVSPAASKNGIGISVGNTNNVGIGIYNGYTATGTAIAVQFQDHNSVVRGSITVTTSGTLYNVTSDYRLKTVIGPITGHGERLDAIKPVDYTWNADGLRTRGFLAHEFQEVYPNSVTGAKDSVDADGNPVYQNMQASTSEVIADLVAEIQSLRIRITQLEAK